MEHSYVSESELRFSGFLYYSSYVMNKFNYDVY